MFKFKIKDYVHSTLLVFLVLSIGAWLLLSYFFGEYFSLSFGPDVLAKIPVYLVKLPFIIWLQKFVMKLWFPTISEFTTHPKDSDLKSPFAIEWRNTVDGRTHRPVLIYCSVATHLGVFLCLVLLLSL